MPQLRFSIEDAEDIIYGANSDFVEVERKHGRAHRWYDEVTITFQQISTGKYYQITYAHGDRDEGVEPFGNFEPVFIEMIPKEESHTVYVPREDAQQNKESNDV